MRLRLLIILTLLSYLAIMLNGEHVGGPLGLMLVFILAQSEVEWSAVSAVVGIGLMIAAAVLGRKGLVKVLAPLGITGMLWPIIEHSIYVAGSINFINERPFVITVSIFLILATLTVISTYRQPRQVS